MLTLNRLVDLMNFHHCSVLTQYAHFRGNEQVGGYIFWEFLQKICRKILFRDVLPFCNFLTGCNPRIHRTS